MESTGTAASHPVPFTYVFTFSLSLGTSGGGTERTGSTGTVWACAVVLQIESQRMWEEKTGFICMLPFTSCARLCSALAGTWNFRTSRTRGMGACSRRDLQRPPHPPLSLSLSLSLCERALSSHPALIRQRKWIRNSFIRPPHIYSFHRLWPLPTCVLISRWRASCHGASITLKRTHNNFSGAPSDRDTHTHTHTHTVCMMLRRTQTKKHIKKKWMI